MKTIDVELDDKLLEQLRSLKGEEQSLEDFVVALIVRMVGVSDLGEVE